MHRGSVKKGNALLVLLTFEEMKVIDISTLL